LQKKKSNPNQIEPPQPNSPHARRPSQSISIRNITKVERIQSGPIAFQTPGGDGTAPTTPNAKGNNDQDEDEDEELSWPSQFLGYARRLSSGLLKIIMVTDPELECVVCCDSFKSGDELAQLNCGHMFHKKCIVDWLNENDKGECPYCRIDVKNYTKRGVPK